MRNVALIVIALLSASCAAAPTNRHFGAYRLDDGRIVSIRRSAADTLRYRVYPTSESGRLFRRDGNEWVSGDGFSVREPPVLHLSFGPEGSLSWRPTTDAAQRAAKVLTVESVEFRSDDATLRGELVLPAGPGPFPAVALIHGSGRDSALDYYYSEDFLAANGVATLVYDKRGSGTSEGEFTFDFEQLARDAIAAVDVLAHHPSVDSDRIGLCAYSQGAWVAPLAASKDERIRFVSVAYGMIESASDEALWETQALLRSRGIDEDGIREATPLIRSAVAIVASGFSDGWDRFQADKRATRGAPWRKKLGGSPVQKLLRYPKWLARMLGPRMAPEGLDWSYASDEVLDALEIPMTWLLGTEDRSAPNEATIAKLREYRTTGKPFELILFEGADHTMLLFDEREGRRDYRGYAADYFRAEVENVLRMSGAVE